MEGGGGELRTTSDNQGGVFVGHSKRIQHLDSTGKKIWNEAGVLFITAETGSTSSTQTFDGNEGVFNFTQFFQEGEGWFVLAQWIDGSGTPRFGPDGKRMTPGMTNGREFDPVSISDGRGAAIVCWNDNRSNSSAVYIARIDTNGIITNIPAPEENIPRVPTLQQNYPNPFNPTTIIKYSIPVRTFVRLIIYDLLGKEVRTLIEGIKEVGNYSVIFHAGDLQSGAYFYGLVTSKYAKVKKMVLIK